MTDYTEVFKEISAIRKGLREPIKHMPKYNRYLVGDDIQKQLLNIKVSVSLVYNYPIGGVVRPNRIYCSNRAVGKLFSKAATKFPEYNKENIEDFISSMNSYLGLMKHYKTYKIRKKFIKKYIKSWLPHIVVSKNYYKINKR